MRVGRIEMSISKSCLVTTCVLGALKSCSQGWESQMGFMMCDALNAMMCDVLNALMCGVLNAMMCDVLNALMCGVLNALLLGFDKLC